MSKKIVIDGKKYTLITYEDKLEIWRMLNGMENYESFEEKRAHRIKLEEIIDMKEIND